MLDKFIKEHIGKKNDNGYGAYPGECVSLVQRFNKALGNPRQWGNGEAYRTNLVNNKLGVHVPLSQARSGDIIAGLNNSHIYGHVALVINSTQVLEQAGPTAGGDGIAKVGTIANFVKRYPDFKVTRLHAYKYVEPIKPINPSEFIEEKGYQMVLNRAVNVRSNPDASNKNNIVKTLEKGSIVPYIGYTKVNGFDWKIMEDGNFIANGPIGNNQEFAKLEKVKEPEKPKLKSHRVIADEVKLGRWGNGQERIDRLTKAGYDAKAIQAIVDADNGKTPPPSKPREPKVGDTIDISSIYNKANNGTSKEPYYKRVKIDEILKGTQAPYKVSHGGKVVGFVKASDLKLV